MAYMGMEMNVNIMDMNQETYELDVEDTATVGDLLFQVLATGRYSRDDHLRVVFFGENLDNNSTLAASGVADGDTLFVLEKLSDEALPRNIGRLSLQAATTDRVDDLEEEVKELTQLAVNPNAGTQIGSGSYGIVHKIQHKRKPYAVKRIDPALQECVRDLDSNNKLQNELRKFALRECLLLSKVQHHNVVQFHGVRLTDDNVLIVMEYLPMSLTSCLESYPNFQLPYKYRIIYDAANGLDFLHSRNPALIHRDVSANNIMLTSDLTAKLVDLGSSVIAGSMKEGPGGGMSPCPGAMVCMPPEAMKPQEEADYDEKLDIFSLGVVMMHVITQNWPIPPEVKSKLSAEDKKLARTPEVEKRFEYLLEMIEVLGTDNHMLIELVNACMQSNPQERPSATKVAFRMEQLTKDFPASNPLETFETVVQKKLHTERLQQAAPPPALVPNKRKWLVSNLAIEARKQLHSLEKQKPHRAASISRKEGKIQEDAVPTLQNMLQELIGISQHYFDLGVLLGIGYNKLQQITFANPNDLNRCLIMVLEEYQKNNDKPTWLAIANSVEIIGHSDIASSIKEKYCSEANNGSSHSAIQIQNSNEGSRQPQTTMQGNNEATQQDHPDLQQTLSDMARQIQNLQARLEARDQAEADQASSRRRCLVM